MVMAELRWLLRARGYRRLVAVRVASQLGDGLLQAGLATSLLFSPQRAASASAVAASFVVVLAPFTIIGPWVGVLLDRWSRQRILVVGSLVRAVLGAVQVVIVVAGAPTWAVLSLAVVLLSIDRFLGAAVTAAIPHVVESDALITANSVTPTVGTLATAAGGAVGVLLGLVMTGESRDIAAIAAAALSWWWAVHAATRFGRADLGPGADGAASHLHPAPAQEAGAVTSELVDGLRHLVARRSPAAALAAMAWQRMTVAVVLIAGVLVSRSWAGLGVGIAPADDPAGGEAMVFYSQIVAAFSLGFALAVLVTPAGAARTGTRSWIAGGLVLGAAGLAIVAVSPDRPAMLVGTAILGMAGQGVKIAVDTVVQRDTDDAYLGRAFAVYDMAYNAAFVVAAVLVVVAVPSTGHSPALLAVLAFGTVVTAAAGILGGARRSSQPAQAPVPVD